MLFHGKMKNTTKRLHLPRLLAACLALSRGTAAFADIAPDPLSGGKNLAIKGREKTNVAMVEEVVKLKLSKDACHVDVVFTMKNTGNKYETMQVGFPNNYADELKDFKASVQGKAVEFKTVKETTPDKSPDGFPSQRTTYWQLWEMTFPPEKPVTITVSYSTKVAFRSTWMVGSRSIENSLGELVPKDDRAALEQQLASRHVEYILKTGGHWSGPIGRCRIEVTFAGMTSDNLELNSPRFEREQATITRDKVVWDLKDYEPKSDVHLSITPGINRKETLALLEKFHKSHPHDPALTEMLAEYLIAFARQPEADQIVLEMLKHWQDKVAIWGPDSETGQTLRQSVMVFSLIRSRTTDTSSPLSGRKPTPFQKPAEFAPVIERIANRVKGQLQYVPANQADRATYFTNQIEQMLAWSRQHSQ